MKIRITEYLDIDLEGEVWCCNRCGQELISAGENYKKGCRVRERDPHEIYNPVINEEYNLSPNPDWVRIIEVYCPGCGTMVENEFLPAGHPITYDIRLDLEALRRNFARREGNG